ncbi:MAG: adenylyl-sulfate kinase [Opitutales bacterium]
MSASSQPSASSSAALYPHFDKMLPRAEKEARLGQRGLVAWLYGLSGSGKSTLALGLERQLFAEGRAVQVLDGDNIRSGLNRDLGFSEADRRENIRRIAEVAKLFAHSGLIVLASFITPREELRALARDLIGPADFLGIYVKASFATCAARDPKGLYAKAQAGQVPQFTGRDQEFEEPAAPDLLLDTEQFDYPATLAQLAAALRPRYQLPHQALKH